MGTRRTILSKDAYCEQCDSTSSGKNAMQWAARHTRKTGHLTWVTVDYGYRRVEANHD